MPQHPLPHVTADEWTDGATVEVHVIVEVPRGVAPAAIIAAIEAALPDAENCGPHPNRPWVVELYITAKNAISGSLLA